MREIELSIMYRDEPLERFYAMLAEFESKTSIHVNLQTLDWESGRSELINMALYHHGPDVSEIGSTWISDLIGMNALLPLSDRQVGALGGAAAFVPALWEGGKLLGDERAWCVPWTAEPALLYYRRDLLQQAGIAESRAFADIAQMRKTLRALQDAGVEQPAALLPSSRYDLLHNVCSFIWAAGGELVSPEGKRVLFDHPQAMQGMVDYFDLARSLPPGTPIEEGDMTRFQTGLAAFTITGSWLLDPGGADPQALAGKLGLALLPAAGFLGFSSLVTWNHTRRPDEAFELMRFLTSPDIQMRYDLPVSQLPTRLELLSQPQISEHANFSTAARAILAGRAFPCMPLSGLVEDRFSAGLAAVAREMLDNRTATVEEIVTARVIPLARRLNMTLSQ